jgi:hypothetical protein
MVTTCQSLRTQRTVESEHTKTLFRGNTFRPGLNWLRCEFYCHGSCFGHESYFCAKLYIALNNGAHEAVES